MHNDDQKKFIDEMNDIMFTIKERFKPVPTIKQANTTFTTSEFSDKIKEHYPFTKLFDLNDVYDLLKQHGYTYTTVGSENKLEWLVSVS